PAHIAWPPSVQRIEHLPPSEHCLFYNQQRFTLNVTRADMIRAGWSPSVRLFEAAACGTPIISDYWEGLNELLEIGKEILVARSTEEAMRFLRGMSDGERCAVGERARKRVLADHTAARRAETLEGYLS